MSACAANGPQDQACKIALATDLPLAIVHNHIVTAALLNGQPTTLAVDTGAALTTLSRQTVQRLNLNVAGVNMTVNGVGGSRGLYGFYARTFKIGDLHGENLYLATADFALTPDGSIEGLLGADYLSHYNVDLDFPEHKARLFAVVSGCTAPSALLDEPRFQAPLAEAPQEANHGSAGHGLGLDEPLVNAHRRKDPRAFVNVQISGKRFLAVIDSGADHTTMFANAAGRLGLTQHKLAAGKQYLIRGIGPQPVLTTRTVMSPITVGEITISNLPIGIAEGSMDDGTDMLLGLDFLSRVHAFISFSSHTLFMQYPPKASPRINF
jgi:predicted aspartyl protease